MIAYGGRWDIRHALEVLPGLSNVALRQCIGGPGSGVTQNKTKIFFLVKYFWRLNFYLMFWARSLQVWCRIFWCWVLPLSILVLLPPGGDMRPELLSCIHSFSRTILLTNLDTTHSNMKQLNIVVLSYYWLGRMLLLRW